MPDAEVLKLLQGIIADVLKTEPDKVLPEIPFMDLGLGSMEGMQLLGVLEDRMGAVLPQEILFEEETTLQSLVPLVKAGGSVSLKRTTVVDAAHLSAIDIPRQSEKERRTRLLKVIQKSSWQTGQLKADALASHTKMRPEDEQQARTLMAIGNSTETSSTKNLSLNAIPYTPHPLHDNAQHCRPFTQILEGLQAW